MWSLLVRMVLKLVILLRVQHFNQPISAYQDKGQNVLLGEHTCLRSVDIANLKWDYDHQIDPLDLAKVCVLLCTDQVNVRNLTISSLDQERK